MFTSLFTTATLRAAASRGLALTLALLVVLSTGGAPIALAATNLIANPGFEEGETGWVLGYVSASSTVSWSAVDTDSHSGSKAGEVVVSDLAVDEDAKLIFTPVTVVPGETYTYSHWYKSDEAGAVNMFTGAGAWLKWLGDTNSTEGTWQEFTAQITVDAGVDSLMIGHAISTVGALLTDDYSFTLASDTPNPNAFDEGFVTLSFDDGWKSVYDNAFPILGNTIPSTQFIYTEAILNAFPTNMTVAELQEMKAAGHEIASHTVGHTDLIKEATSSEAVRYELEQSRQDILDLGLGTPVSFAYPYGSCSAGGLGAPCDSDLVQALRDAGYYGARTVDSDALNFRNTDPYELKIQHVTNETTVADIEGWIDAAVAQNAWLILMFHEITDGTPTTDNCNGAYGSGQLTECSDVSVLSGVVDHLNTNSIPVRTMRQGLEMMGIAIPADEEPALPGAASTPLPENGVTDVATTTTLAWTAGTSGTSVGVFLGTNSTISDEDFRGAQSAGNTTYDPAGLAASTTYYWRVDTANSVGTTTGTVWSFTTAATDDTSVPDTVPPVITINPYETGTTTSPITVTASVNEGTLNTESYTFYENGSFDFVATDDAGNTATSTVTITNIVIDTPDTIAPEIAEVTPVSATTTDTTPEYAFSATEAGAITYGGSCIGDKTTAVVGTTTVTFNELALGVYSDCTITVTDDAENVSDVLNISPFEVVAEEGTPVECPAGTHDDGTGTCVTDTPPTTGGGGGGGGGSINDTSAPRNTSVTINGGAATTTSSTVTLSLTATDSSTPIQVQVSNTNSFSSATWTALVSPMDWTLATGTGTRSVYARFKDAKGNTSSVVSDTILVVSADTATEPGDATGTPPVGGGVLGAATFKFVNDLSRGMQTSAVYELQKRLRDEGFFTFPVLTGYYGVITEQAVRQYQEHHGLAVTGQLDSATRNHLNGATGTESVDDISFESFVQLLVSFGLIPQDKVALALAAIRAY